ncbi:hypothetical protein HII36_45195 [Nonomuraea sp. NN258]|uniref:AfsR/SARP family transcriptional regulator n=1 Tax=Nonomuraea antri TaxID=2730852 RepID=UPI00156A5332|nr:BTAD domain-containing putative transcriptional regulator [Nonomuraea antri]NRQ38970.1 hypothetical protein [Nonomuraea antri]
MTVRILGPVVGHHSGAEIDLGSPRQRAVIAMLASRPGQVITMGQLLEGVWGENPPASAEQSVYTYVAGLRRIIEPDRRPRQPPTTLIRLAGGYQLRIEPRAIDSFVLAEHLDTAERLRESGDLDGALHAFDRALRLWRGPTLSGIPGPFAEHERSRLDELRLSALEGHAETLRLLGRPQEAVEELRDLTRAHPLRERPYELLMLALHGCGRESEAIMAFEEARAVLADELGVAPGEGLRAAHQLVLAATGDDGAGVPGPPRQLPRDLIGFVGRAQDTMRLRTLLIPHGDEPPPPLVVISGPAGVGKSALAVRIAHMVKGQYPQGQLYVNLRGGTPNVPRLTPHEALSRLLRGLGLRDENIPVDADEAAAVLRSRLHGNRLLILLDDAADLTQIRPLLSSPLGTTLLVTSRESLSVGDDCVQLSLGPLSSAEATAMLAKLVGGRIAADHAESVRLVQLCDGLPLALRIAGARLADRPDWSVRGFADRLSDERRRLHELEVGELAVRSSLAASLQALRHGGRDAAAARMLALLGLLHVPDITVETAAALSGTPEAAAERALERLSDAHLLERGAAGRYQLHDLVRLFASELPCPEGRLAPLTRVLGHFAASARAAMAIVDPHRVHADHPAVTAAGRGFDDAEEAMAWLLGEEPSLVAAAVQAMADPDEAIAKLGVAIGFAIMWHQQKAYRVADMLRMGRQELTVGERYDDDGIRMHAHAQISAGMHLEGSLSDALTHLEQQLELARRLKDRFNEQRAHGNLAATYTQWEKFEEALPHALAQREIACGIGSGVGERYAQLMIGVIYQGLGRLLDAQATLEKGRAMAQAVGDRMHEANMRSRLGQVLLDRGEHEKGRAELERALPIARISGTRVVQMHSLIQLARAHRLLGQEAQARARISEALHQARVMESPYWLKQVSAEQEAIGMERDGHPLAM